MRGILLSILSVAVAFRPQSSSATDSVRLSLPFDHPASIQCSAWLAAFNTADRETLATYHDGSTFPYSDSSWSITGIEHELSLAQMTGGYSVADVESLSLPSHVVVVLKENNCPRYTRVDMHVDIFKPNYPVTNFNMRHINTPLKFIPKDHPRRLQYERALRPLDAFRRRIVVDGINSLLVERYVNSELTQKIVNTLNVNYESGDYDSIEESEKFARRLTEDLQAASHDNNLVLEFIEPSPERNDGGIGDESENHLDGLRGWNFGFGPVSFDNDSIHDRTIATLPIIGFVGSTEEFADSWQEIRAAIGDILSSIADADALLIDLRQSYGGDPNTLTFILSYLLDNGPLHQLDFVDSSEVVQKSHSLLPVDELPPGTKRFGGTKPLFVLTTNETMQSSENMAYSLQASKRAIAVIGEGNEATLGMANDVSKVRFICEEEFGKEWWLVIMSDLKPVHEITGSNWEGVGVKSDVIAGRGEWEGINDAKEVARRLAMRALQSEQEL